MVMHSEQRLDQLFHALADPTRRRILEWLARGDEPVKELVSRFAISQPAVTKHLNVLEDAGLISRKKEGRERRCRLRPLALQGTVGWVERCRRMWNDRFDALDAVLAETLDEEK
jgi:DNA-binding transcriptional ArsR family regulator